VSLLRTSHRNKVWMMSLLAQVLHSGPAIWSPQGTVFLGPSMHWLEEGPSTCGIIANLSVFVGLTFTLILFVVFTTFIVFEGC
jgi:hypothetical protein